MAAEEFPNFLAGVDVSIHGAILRGLRPAAGPGMSAPFNPIEKYFRWAFLFRRCQITVTVLVLNHFDG